MNLQNLLEKRKPLELKDPKKTLKGFFDREGKFVCDSKSYVSLMITTFINFSCC